RWPPAPPRRPADPPGLAWPAAGSGLGWLSAPAGRPFASTPPPRGSPPRPARPRTARRRADAGRGGAAPRDCGRRWNFDWSSSCHTSCEEFGCALLGLRFGLLHRSRVTWWLGVVLNDKLQRPGLVLARLAGGQGQGHVDPGLDAPSGDDLPLDHH